jgi:hypothetical protein
MLATATRTVFVQADEAFGRELAGVVLSLLGLLAVLYAAIVLVMSISRTTTRATVMPPDPISNSSARLATRNTTGNGTSL